MRTKKFFVPSIEKLPVGRFNRIKRGALKRNIPFCVNMDDLSNLFKKQRGKCALTGFPLTFYKYEHCSELPMWLGNASLDRIDSGKGYTIDNVRWVHKYINIMKWSLSDEEFLHIANAIFCYKYDRENIVENIFDKKLGATPKNTIVEEDLEFRPDLIQNDRTGQICKNNIQILEYAGHKKQLNGKRTSCWKCKCFCGNIFTSTYHPVSVGKKSSCGCSSFPAGSSSKYWRGCGDISGHLVCHIKKGAAERDINFDVDGQYLWDLFIQQDKKCSLTGWDIYFNNNGEQTASLDRIDSSVGYVKGNLSWVHKKVNVMKWSLDPIEFLNMIVLLVKHQYIENLPRWTGDVNDDIWDNIVCSEQSDYRDPILDRAICEEDF